MNARTWLLALIVIPLLALPARAQEGVRDLTGAQNSKFLTPNQLDRWLFEGEKGETIIAHLVSKDFDPILELARTGAKEEKPLVEVDDPGSESRFAFRLPEKGKFEIRVHAFKFQGGGNYALRVQRFQASPLVVGKPLVGRFDREGKSYHYFPAVKDQILVPDLNGASSEAWRALDSKGRDTKGWAGTVLVEAEGEGESYLIVSGQPEQRYDLVVREARRHDLVAGKEQPGNLLQGESDVWSFSGKPGDFLLVEVEKKGELHARLVYAPPDRKSESRLARPGDRPEIEFLPVANRGGRLRFVAVLGREGRYQLQLVAESAASYKLTMRDPSVPIVAGKDIEGNLPVGGTAFYSFKAVPGQLLQASLSSQKFVPLLRLYDMHGTLVAASGDDADALVGRITHMVLSEGTYRLQVSSVGDGGGGEFQQVMKEATVEELKIGERGKGTLQPGATDFRVFEGKEGQTVFLSVRSTSLDPVVSIRGPDGVLLAADNRGSAATGSLFALKLPKSGRYTVWIASRRGAGEYTVRLIDGD
jgi:hypothetical protein